MGAFQRIPWHHKKVGNTSKLKKKLDGQPTVNIIEDNQVVDTKSLIIDISSSGNYKNEGWYVFRLTVNNNV